MSYLFSAFNRSVNKLLLKYSDLELRQFCSASSSSLLFNHFDVWIHVAVSFESFAPPNDESNSYNFLSLAWMFWSGVISLSGSATQTKHSQSKVQRARSGGEGGFAFLPPWNTIFQPPFCLLLADNCVKCAMLCLEEPPPFSQLIKTDTANRDEGLEVGGRKEMGGLQHSRTTFDSVLISFDTLCLYLWLETVFFGGWNQILETFMTTRNIFVFLEFGEFHWWL